MIKSARMSRKIGRNESCWCGSGKKHKKCCANEAPERSEVIDFEWKKLRAVENGVIQQHLLPYFMKQGGAEIIDALQLKIIPDSVLDCVDDDIFLSQFFIPWLLFSWSPDKGELLDGVASDTLGKQYLKRYLNRLDSDERQFLATMNSSYYSFYHVIEVVPGKAVRVSDIFLQTEYLVKERQGTRYLKPGDVVFSRVITQEGQSILVGMAPYLLGSQYQLELIARRESFVKANENRPLSLEVVREDLQLIFVGWYFTFLDEIFNSPAAEFHPGDDEPLVFSQSYFKLLLPIEEALDRLLPLCLDATLEELLELAERNEANEVIRVVFPLFKLDRGVNSDWGCTVMGHLTVEQDRLIFETNVQEWAHTGEALLQECLGQEGIVFQRAVLELPKTMQKAEVSLPVAY